MAAGTSADLGLAAPQMTQTRAGCLWLFILYSYLYRARLDMVLVPTLNVTYNVAAVNALYGSLQAQ
jgi:hypothetical protein